MDFFRFLSIRILYFENHKSRLLTQFGPQIRLSKNIAITYKILGKKQFVKGLFDNVSFNDNNTRRQATGKTSYGSTTETTQKQKQKQNPHKTTTTTTNPKLKQKHEDKQTIKKNVKRLKC